MIISETCSLTSFWLLLELAWDFDRPPRPTFARNVLAHELSCIEPAGRFVRENGMTCQVNGRGVIRVGVRVSEKGREWHNVRGNNYERCVYEVIEWITHSPVSLLNFCCSNRFSNS